jgi:hypothetical protein
LNQAKNNRVEIALPGLGPDAVDRAEFMVNCKNPVRAQRLYLLPLGLTEVHAEQVRAQAVKTLRPFFDDVEVYTPRRGRRAYIVQQLQTIRYKIERLATAGLLSSSIVVLYYHGGEVDAQGNLRIRTDPSNAKERQQVVLTRAELDEFAAPIPGAHSLLFDADRETSKSSAAKDKLAGRRDNYSELEPLVALLRDVWPSRTTKTPRLIQELQPDSQR